mmetsp:Transcript_63907/g.112864  ORF Transcript_63907/g.112864 Transcript_63907/m.112864 type:complete len:204 (-) Transcript_63907:521-1132(-)
MLERDWPCCAPIVPPKASVTMLSDSTYVNTPSAAFAIASMCSLSWSVPKPNTNKEVPALFMERARFNFSAVLSLSCPSVNRNMQEAGFLVLRFSRIDQPLRMPSRMSVPPVACRERIAAVAVPWLVLFIFNSPCRGVALELKFTIDRRSFVPRVWITNSIAFFRLEILLPCMDPLLSSTHTMSTGTFCRLMASRSSYFTLTRA